MSGGSRCIGAAEIKTKTKSRTSLSILLREYLSGPNTAMCDISQEPGVECPIVQQYVGYLRSRLSRRHNKRPLSTNGDRLS